jgi:pterin-4a-carbinolamine dehydratase
MLVELFLAELDHEAHRVSHHQTVYEDFKQLQLLFDWRPHCACGVKDSVVFDFVLAEDLDNMAQNVDDEKPN